MRVQLLRQLDWLLLLPALVLTTLGIVMIYSLTYGRGVQNLALIQAGVSAVGLLLAGLIATLDYRHLRTLSLPLFLVGLLLLGTVALFGTTIFGATRWLTVAGIQFQPSELVKLLAIILAAALLRPPAGERSWLQIGVLLGTVGLAGWLVVRQPDLGTTVVLVLSLGALMVAAQLPRPFWLVLGGLAAVNLPVLWLGLEPYQLDRIETFLAPSRDPSGAGYNVLQSLIAVGNGGLLGQGLGQGTQSQLDFLPVVHTDFIFAGIAEATGLVGSLVVLGLFGLLIARSLVLAGRAPDRFGRLVAVGVAALWFVQVAINIGMTIGLAPVTGIPLPLVSYGGTALITNLAALGLLESIAIRSKLVRSVA